MAERVLFSAENLQLTIGRQVIFNGAELACHEGERIALIGRNGCGKSTLLRIIAGEEEPSDGLIARERNLRIALMPQELALDESRSALDNIRDGLAWIDELHRRYESALPPAEHEWIERQLNRCDGWQPERKLEAIAGQLRIADAAVPLAKLSGGEKRRVALARAIIAEPDLLMLDEPTNHLDVSTIEWIEEFLGNWRGTCLFVTHDRYFLDRLATRILELDHGKIYSYNGSYADYLASRAEREAIEDVMEGKRRKFLRDEIEWVRRSPKARLRRNVGRLKHFESIAAQSGPERDSEMELVIPRAPRLGNQTVQFKDVSLRFGERSILEHFDFEFTPGCRLGVAGPNGIGKTTFLRLATGELAPTSGEVKIAPTVQFNYIDQTRLVLDENKTVAEEIGEGLSTIQLGTETITIWGYLKRFLFEDERINTRIQYLSGGEKARLTLAKILKRGGNFLILDEPTNDLDLSSLRLLEEALLDFDGCLVTVSHDRYFLNRVSTHILGFDETGRWFFTPGDYDYYLAKRPRPAAAAPPAPAPAPVPAPTPRRDACKLSYKEKKELDTIENTISEAESEVAELEETFGQPDFFARHGTEIPALQEKLAQAQTRVKELYARWEYLENHQEK